MGKGLDAQLAAHEVANRAARRDRQADNRQAREQLDATLDQPFCLSGPHWTLREDGLTVTSGHTFTAAETQALQRALGIWAARFSTWLLTRHAPAVGIADRAPHNAGQGYSVCELCHQVGSIGQQLMRFPGGRIAHITAQGCREAMGQRIKRRTVTARRFVMADD